MRKISILCVAGILAWTAVPGPPLALAQVNSQRKILTRVAPRYSDLAKRMRAHGTVRIAVLVRTNGTVKTTKVLGGSPVLVQPAIEAVRQWRFAVSQNETTEIVNLNFVYE